MLSAIIVRVAYGYLGFKIAKCIDEKYGDKIGETMSNTSKKVGKVFNH